MIRADVWLEVATTDLGGWDTHVNQGAAQGQLANRLNAYASALAAFAQDLGPRMQEVCVLTVTEFGRTVRENGNHGTDHGTGSLMMAFGGGVRGERVLGHGRRFPRSLRRRLALGAQVHEHRERVPGLYPVRDTGTVRPVADLAYSVVLESRLHPLQLGARKTD